MILKQHYWPFWHLYASGRSCKHNVDILSPYKVVIANVLANQQTHRSKVSIYLEPFFVTVLMMTSVSSHQSFLCLYFQERLLNASLCSLVSHCLCQPAACCCSGGVLLLYQSCLLHVWRMVVMVVITKPIELGVTPKQNPNRLERKTQSQATILWFHHNKRHISCDC